MLNNIRVKFCEFLRDENGGVFEAVIIAGLISLPLGFFLIVFGQNVNQWVKSKTPNMMHEETQWIE